MKKASLFLFIAVVAGQLLALLFAIEWLGFICKPLIMVSLGLYYTFAVDRHERSLVIIGAIVFSFAGDVFLIFPDYFIPGLISFLVAHLLYIVAYRQHRHEADQNSLKGVQTVRLSFPVILAGTGLVIILYPSLGELQIPVIVYALVLVLMVLNALFRFGYTTATSFWMVFGGAVLFMISDSVLAVNKFVSSFSQAGLTIMATYMAGQFLIVNGLVRHTKL